MVIEFNNVGEKFRLYHQKNNDLKGRIFDLIKGKRHPKEEFWALKEVSFEIHHGEVVGIIGENGSGKTTILNLIAGILKPDEGEIKIQGRVSALLELGTGFHPELSGRENIYLYGAVLGLSKKVIDSKFDEIVRFAELKKFIDAPVKTYSAGMYVRLGFAIAINVDPDILLIDEVLAVGDEAYQRKCIQKINEFKTRGKTIIIVSHSMDLIALLCNRAIVLREGRTINDSTTSESINMYLQTVGEKSGIAMIRNNNIDLIFNNGRLYTFYNRKFVTKGPGGHISFLYSMIAYNSCMAKWTVQYNDEHRLEVKGDFIGLPFYQVWEIEFCEEELISWKIYMVNNTDKLKISSFQTNLMLVDKYRRWFSCDQEGDFPDEFLNSEWFNIPLVNKNSRICGVCALQENDLPPLLIDFSETALDSQSLLYNTDKQQGCRVLQVNVVDYDTLSELAQGKHLLFSSKIRYFDTIDSLRGYIKDMVDRKLNNCSIENDYLKLTFDLGRLRIFYDGKELTKGLGVYTSTKTNNLWRDSTHFNWTVEKREDVLIAKGKSLFLPCSENWQIQIIDKRVVQLAIYLEVAKQMVAQNIQVNAMLSEQYKRWFVGSSKSISGEFPQKFDVGHLEEWQDLWQGNLAVGMVGAEPVIMENMNLPSVTLKCQSEDSDRYLKIFNSDTLFEGRVLQCAKEKINESIKLHPGKYEVFTGTLTIKA